MAFPLSKIELHIDDDIIAEAEQLLQEDRLSGIVETDSDLWIGLAQEAGNTYEVEVLLKKGRVTAHTCECGNSDKKNYCTHVVSLLLELLKKQKQRTTKKVKPKEQKIPKRITVPYVLDLVSAEELKSFIKEYASQDRQFGLLLKAQFAYLLPRTADNEPISETLANILKSVKKPGKTISKSDWKVINKVLDTFLQQAEEALYKKHYADVFEIAEAILTQLSPMLLLTEERSVFIKAIDKSFQTLTELTKAELAPELENELWNLIIEEAENRVYYFYDLWQALGELLLEMANTKERSAELLSVFEEKSEDKFVQKHPEISAGLVNFKIQLFDLQNNEAALQRYLEENINHPEVLKQAISLAEKTEHWTQLEQLCNFALLTQKTEEEELQLKEKLLLAYNATNRKALVQKLSQELFLKTLVLNYFKILKESAGSKWPLQRSNLFEKLEELPTRVEKIKTMAEVYALEEMTPELRDHLSESLSLDLLRRYDKLLFKESIIETEQLYKKVIRHYLENYLGRPAAVKVRDAILHLKKHGRKGVAQSIIRLLYKEYSDRGSLMEELKEIA
ncbi:MAG: SWIM zinc finger family protein [Saprospiraceae bacterium]